MSRVWLTRCISWEPQPSPAQQAIVVVCAYLGSGVEELARFLFDGRVEGFSARQQGLVHQHLAIQVEAVKGVQADLHLDVCHLHILARPGGQHLPCKPGFAAAA